MPDGLAMQATIEYSGPLTFKALHCGEDKPCQSLGEDHQVSINATESEIRMLVLSMQNKLLPSDIGFEVIFNSSDEMAESPAVKVREMLWTDSNKQIFGFKAADALPGQAQQRLAENQMAPSCACADLSQNGAFDVLDVVQLVAVVLGSQSPPLGWQDPTLNGTWDVMDVVAVIGVMLDPYNANSCLCSSGPGPQVTYQLKVDGLGAFTDTLEVDGYEMPLFQNLVYWSAANIELDSDALQEQYPSIDENVVSIIGQGVAATRDEDGDWISNLLELKQGEYYLFDVATDISLTMPYQLVEIPREVHRNSELVLQRFMLTHCEAGNSIPFPPVCENCEALLAELHCGCGDSETFVYNGYCLPLAEEATWSAETSGGTEHIAYSASDNTFVSAGDAGDTGVYLAKHNAAGGELWNRSFSGSQTDDSWYSSLTGLTVLSDGGIVISGYFSGTLEDLGSEDGTQLSAPGRTDVFLAKYSADGALLWRQQQGGRNQQSSNSGLTALSNNVIIQQVSTEGPANFLGEDGSSSELCGETEFCHIFARYAPGSGALLEAKVWSRTSLEDDVSLAAPNPTVHQLIVATDGSDALFVTGARSGQVRFGDSFENETEDSFENDILTLVI